MKIRPIRVIGGLLIVYNIAAVIALLKLSDGQVYALAIMALVLASAVLICEIRLKTMLMRARDNEYTSLFIVLIILSIYYSVFTLLLLIYFNLNQASETMLNRYRMIIIQNLSYSECVWLNLGFYGANALLYWVYTQRYYHFSWINFIRQIFWYLKAGCRQLSQGLLQKLKPIQVPDDLLRTECTLCLEKFNLVQEVSRLPCKHCFHTECIRLWLIQKPSCPLCRGNVILY